MLNFTILGGVADRVGGLKRGDQLLSVNGVSVEGENHEKAVELLKAAIGSVKLVVRLELWLCYKTTNNFQTKSFTNQYGSILFCRYTPKVLEEMEMRFDKQRQARRRHLYS